MFDLFYSGNYDWQLNGFCYSGGSLFLFNRKALRNFRKDGHCWRKKKDGKTVREAHEKLKVCCSIYYYLMVWMFSNVTMPTGRKMKIFSAEFIGCLICECS
ncbi:hypothetical protein SLEP1_g18676 [Rubroshorea leprosula]|uniref:CG-1 domain-containing protein n=1 Tax=Rubroshorea leprosula TaxID=152421 RepID=A0AAV5J468_9ROSI|nr:hypothetical protein SLEP1_g18676 [Rubroshorea leprosula]